MGEETMSSEPNPNSDISGASGSQPQSVSQIASVFSYPAEGGDIFVYLVRGGTTKFAIITYDDSFSENAYAVQTLASNPSYEALGLVQNAEKAFSNPFSSNPFTELINDDEAMTKLIVVLSEFLHSGE